MPNDAPVDDGEPVTESDRLDFALGQIAALKNFCLAVIRLHPNPASLAKGLNALVEMGVSNTPAGPASDAMIEGMEDMKASLAAAAQIEVRRQGDPRKR